MQTIEIKRQGFSLKEIAMMYGFSLGFVEKEVRHGKLRARKVGRRLIVLQEDLKQWLDVDSREAVA
jgi:excisionase family DNA binding protein